MYISRQGLILSLALVAPLALAQAPWSLPTQPASSTAIQAEAWQLVQLANQVRAQAGAGPLQWDAALATAARQHCLRMAAVGQLSHQFAGEPDVSARAEQAGANFSLIEENVALAPTPAAIHNAWMHSPGHRANLLNPQVDHIGVAVVAGRHGLYAVADYERAVTVLTQAQIEAQIAGLMHGVTILPDPTLARTACTAEGAPPRPASGPRPHFAMYWEDAQLTQLPKDLADALASGKYHQAAVGSCSAQGDEGSFTAYRIAVLLY
ncbi:MAG TPA: CAP domain-containing protein [Terracidiphilus sp.]|nr:CAP domain-containing protein [Terracidiphilus sp.]